jgi:hypothetical protein
MARTLAVSFPMPVLAPVNTTTLPVRSGMSCTRNVGLEGKAWLNQDPSPLMTTRGSGNLTRGEVRSMGVVATLFLWAGW